jgi:hypothetical protein
MAALIARLAPWSVIALAAAGFVIWGGRDQARGGRGRHRAAREGPGGERQSRGPARPEAQRHRNQGHHCHGEGLCGAGHARVRSVSCHACCF